MNHLDTGLIKKTNAADLVRAWEQANAIMDAAYLDLERANQILKSAFGENCYMDVYPRHNDSLERMRQENKKRAWRQVINLLEVRKVMSIKRIEEMDRNLESGNMPDITLDNILQISTGLLESASEFAAEAILEVFEFLRPGASDHNRHKTNTKHARFELGKKVIITRACEMWSRQVWHISHWRMDKIRAVDRVFHLADGAGELKGYSGPLVDAIQTSAENGGQGETEYFRFKVYGNGNLHLEFKRPDLVAKLNAVSGNPTHLKGK